MLRIRTGWTMALLVILAVAVGCGGGDQEAADAARQEALAALQEVKSELDAKRQELADLRAQMAAAPAEGEEEAAGEEEGAEGEEEVDPEAQLAELEGQVRDLSENFGAKLVEFINADPPIVGEPLSEVQLGAIRMKSDEDMVMAMTYIDEGGDYRRAIRIYEDALAADPDNEKLKAALAEAEELRYMTAERLEQVKNGMTQDEVRALIGQVNLRGNVREYPDKEVVAWFYPTADDGSAAGVFFRKRRGEYQVYEVNFEAVKPKTEEEG